MSPTDRSIHSVWPTPFGVGRASFASVLEATSGENPLSRLSAAGTPLGDSVIHGTTVLALTFADGVIIAGDRRATSGNLISKRDMRKIFPTDEHSAVGIAGVAALAMEMAKLFATELEHYEKVDGHRLSLSGKANMLSGFVRANMPAVMQGLAVVPLFAGFDVSTGRGRIYEFDSLGGAYVATDFGATGSGSLFTRGVLKRAHHDDLNAEEAAIIAIDALYEAADEDSATGGPDLIRKLYPIVAKITADGYDEFEDSKVAEMTATLVRD